MIQQHFLRCFAIQNTPKLSALRKFSVTTFKANDEVIEKDITFASQQTQVPVRPPLPLYTSRKLAYPSKFKIPLQAWVNNLDTIEEEKLGIIDLHPDIFGVYPRIDMIYKNVHWQKMYRHINWSFAPSRAEMHGGGRKPWPQKGTGRARHGSIRSPLFKHGAKAHGPRGPKTYFWMLPLYMRINGLISTLSAKLAQDDIKIVDSLEISTDEPKFLENLIEQRHWGLSVLLVDDTDIMPRNIALACDDIPQFNLMPVYGLNVYSMLKHETLVLTVAAVEKIEERLMYHLHRIDSYSAEEPFKWSRYPYSPLIYEHILPKVESY